MARKKNFPLRISPELYEALERWADAEFRSVNAHMEYLLREAAYKAGKLSSRTHARETGEEEKFEK